jgi:7,8-dihydroneopterin aldolase/epimerase/oxygenase
MITTMIAQNIEVDMFIGICDFEYLNKQKVVVNIQALGNTPLKPVNISECLDYSKICEFVSSWTSRGHVDLVETLLYELFDFCFKQDDRIFEVHAEIIKPQVISYAKGVGVRASLTREQFEHEKTCYAV